MEQEKKEIEQPNKSTDSDKKRMPKWLRRTLKTVAWTIGSFITLVVVVLCLIVWILTPPRLTPIVESVANDYLNAEVSIGRAELTIWKTFPYMVIDLQKVDVKSKALNGYKGSLPAGSDSLLSVGKVHASFNIAEIPLMKFNIRNILIDEPRINVVIASDSLSNLDIFPPSEEKEEGPSPFIINSLVVNKFQITNNRGITYTDMRDSTYARIDTKTISLDYETDRFYSFLFDGDVHFKSPARQINQSIPIYIKGAALWDIKDPTHCVVRNLNLNVADIPVTLDTDMRFDSVLAVNSLNIAVGPVVFDKVFRHVPANYRYGLDAFKTNFSASAKFTLAAPYKLTGRYYPTFKAELTIPDCYVTNQKKGTRINEFGIAANLDFNGLMPNQSTLMAAHPNHRDHPHTPARRRRHSPQCVGDGRSFIERPPPPCQNNRARRSRDCIAIAPARISIPPCRRSGNGHRFEIRAERLVGQYVPANESERNRKNAQHSLHSPVRLAAILRSQQRHPLRHRQ